MAGATSSSSEGSSVGLHTGEIREWRSIITLIVFVLTNLVVLRPFKIPVYIPKSIRDLILSSLSALRIISPPPETENRKTLCFAGIQFSRFMFPMNIITAPLAADLFLLAILAIGREEVAAGTIDIMAFFITLAYIAVSLDATGLIRYVAFKVLEKAGKHGRRLYFYLYMLFFGLTACIGNDPIILSGTPFLAYMTRVSKNIDSPRAWIFTQFTMANVASTILVSSNPTNLVLAGAFQVRFVDYTANVAVPVVITTILLFPFLVYVVFRERTLIPEAIEMYELSDEQKDRKPVNPNIPFANSAASAEDSKLLSLEEIMNPYLDKWSAAFVAALMAITLITVLVLNAATAGSGTGGHAYPVYWCTLPGAFVTFCWDVAAGWKRRHETREIAREGRRSVENGMTCTGAGVNSSEGTNGAVEPVTAQEHKEGHPTGGRVDSGETIPRQQQAPTTLSSLLGDAWTWARETFPNASHVLALLPWALVPFAFAMFVLVQALVTKGWVPVFAYGWDAWVNKTGTVGAVGGMGFLSVILCNFAGTNIGTTILISRVIQAWQAIHEQNGIPISDRTFWATVYSMAIGVNYGAFSLAFSGALAGMLWRDILIKKHIKVGNIEFARVNFPIIVFTMIVGCAVLVGEVYIIRGTDPHQMG